MRTREMPSNERCKSRIGSRFTGSTTLKSTRTSEAGIVQHLRGLIRWFSVVPIVILLIFLCSELALAFGNTPEEVDTRSRIITDYGPWESVTFRAMEDGITTDIKDDLLKYGDGSEIIMARLSDPIKAPGEFAIMIFETPTSTPSPTKTVKVPPPTERNVTASPTPTAGEGDPETITPTPSNTGVVASTHTTTPSPSPTTITETPTPSETSTLSYTATSTSTITPTVVTVTPTSTISPTPDAPPALCFEGGGWHAFHYHGASGAHNYVGTEFHEGHGMPDGPMALNSVIIESVRLRQVEVADVERIEKVQVGWRNGTLQDFPWSGPESADVTIPIGIEMPLAGPPLDHFYRASYATFFLNGDIDGSYQISMTIYIPEYSTRCSLTAGYSTQ